MFLGLNVRLRSSFLPLSNFLASVPELTLGRPGFFFDGPNVFQGGPTRGNRQTEPRGGNRRAGNFLGRARASLKVELNWTELD